MFWQKSAKTVEVVSKRENPDVMPGPCKSCLVGKRHCRNSRRVAAVREVEGSSCQTGSTKHRNLQGQTVQAVGVMIQSGCKCVSTCQH